VGSGGLEGPASPVNRAIFVLGELVPLGEGVAVGVEAKKNFRGFTCANVQGVIGF
jgi:hypothetical protein